MKYISRLTFFLVMVTVLVLSGEGFAKASKSTSVPAVPQKPDSLAVKVQRIEIGPAGIIIKDQSGKIIEIHDPSEIDLRQIDSILEKSGKSKIEIQRLKTQIEQAQESLWAEIPEWDDTHQQDVVRFGSSIHIPAHEVVEGDVVCIGCSIEIDGQVRGAAVSIGGQVIVTNSGMVEGDAVAVGGHVVKHPGGKVGGENVSLPFIPFPTFAFYRGAQLASVMVFFFLLVFLGIVAVSLAPKNVAKVKAKIEQGFIKSLLIGVLWQILLFPVALLLLVTIIGIPIAVLILPLLVLAAISLGFVAISQYVGERVRENLKMGARGTLAAVVTGITTIFGLMLLWAFLDFASLYVSFIGGLHLLALVLLGLSVLYLYATAGFGAAVMTKLGTRPKDKTVQPAASVAPPPQPSPPAPATA